ncbi:MAG: hypothetical protein ACK559_36965, partial [bacterium]
VGGNPSWCRHGALNGHLPLRPWLRSSPEALLQLDLLRHLCGGEALARRVPLVPHGLVSRIQCGALPAHYHKGMAKRGLHQPHAHRWLLGVFQEYRQPL